MDRNTGKENLSNLSEFTQPEKIEGRHPGSGFMPLITMMLCFPKELVPSALRIVNWGWGYT